MFLREYRGQYLIYSSWPLIVTFEMGYKYVCETKILDYFSFRNLEYLQNISRDWFLNNHLTTSVLNFKFSCCASLNSDFLAAFDYLYQVLTNLPNWFEIE